MTVIPLRFDIKLLWVFLLIILIEYSLKKKKDSVRDFKKKNRIFLKLEYSIKIIN